MFKILGKSKENAADLIKGTFPEYILQKLDLDTLTPDNNSYIDKELQEYYSDLVYDCIYSGNTDIKISLLFEHKSYVPDYPNLQILRYMQKIWDFNIKPKESLKPVIPIVFYHGKEKWIVKPFAGCFKQVDDILAGFIPSFDYLLTDLANYSDEELKQKLFSREANKLICLIMKHIFEEDYLKQEFENIFIIIKNYIETEEGADFLISTLTYIFSTTEIDKDFVTNKLNYISKTGGDIAMTTAMKLREEGRKEKARDDAKKMLKKKYPVDEIVEITGLTKEEIDKLK